MLSRSASRITNRVDSRKGIPDKPKPVPVILQHSKRVKIVQDFLWDCDGVAGNCLFEPPTNGDNISFEFVDVLNLRLIGPVHRQISFAVVQPRR